MNLGNIIFPPIQWWIVTIFVLSATGVMILYIRHSKGHRKIPLFLRLVLFLLILLLIFHPAKTIHQKLSDKPALAILIDRSSSMDTNDPVSRLDLVKKIISEESKFMQDLKEKYSLYPFIFSSSSEHILIKDLLQMKLGQGQATDIGLALKQTSEELEGKHLAGIIMVTDGIHNGQWDPLTVARSLNIPVICIGVGNRQKFQDLAIIDVATSDFVFSNTAASVQVNVIAKGYEEQEISLILKKGLQIIQTKKIRVSKEEELIKTKFEFSPQGIGNFTYTVSIPHYKGEFSFDNNNKDFSLQVLREKTRILYICGQPSWEYKFLREVLKKNSSIDLVSFIILRNPENITIVSERDLSLIPFPVEEIFLKEIFDFDVLIFENFSYTRFFPAAYLENIRKFVVDEGKAFIMLGGNKSFGRGGYQNTAIEDILPVFLEGNAEQEVIGKFKLEVSDFAHPIVHIGDDLKENQRIWQEMPQLDGCSKILRTKPGAIILGIHPRVRGEEQNLPVLAVWQKGKGRVMVLTSNTTWRWSLGLASEGKTSFLYNRFWQRAIRWLIKAPEIKLVRLSSDKKEYLKGEKIKIIITVLDEYYHPLKNAKLNLEVISPLGKKTIFNENNIFQVQPGNYEAELESDVAGKYTFEAVAYKNGKLLDKDNNFCNVAVSNTELSRLNLDENLLKEIAKITNGKYLHIEDIEKDKNILPDRLRQKVISISKQVEMWDSAYLYFLIIFMLGAEWYVRRKTGML